MGEYYSDRTTRICPAGPGVRRPIVTAAGVASA